MKRRSFVAGVLAAIGLAVSPSAHARRKLTKAEKEREKKQRERMRRRKKRRRNREKAKRKKEREARKDGYYEPGGDPPDDGVVYTDPVDGGDGGSGSGADAGSGSGSGAGTGTGTGDPPGGNAIVKGKKGKGRRNDPPAPRPGDEPPTADDPVDPDVDPRFVRGGGGGGGGRQGPREPPGDNDGSATRGGGSGGSTSTVPGVTKLKTHHYRIKKSTWDYYLGDVGRVKKLASPSAFKDSNNKTIGYQLWRIRRGSLLWGAGLRNGDVIHTVNGRNVRNIPQALMAYRAFKRASNLEVYLSRKRDGKRKYVTLRYQIR